MIQYANLVRDILQCGIDSEDRTGTGTKSMFSHKLEFNLAEDFPLVTLKRTWFKGVCVELDWMLKGHTNVKWLRDRGVDIWDKWADENGELGPTYGKQLRQWAKFDYDYDYSQSSGVGRKVTLSGYVDPLAECIEGIKKDPYGRRHVLTLWNHSELHNTRLPPCTGSVVQFYVRNGELSCFMHQRSCDVFIGLPFDVASFSLLTMIIARVCNLKPLRYVHSIGDAHLYYNHLTHAKNMLNRTPYRLPSLTLPDYESIDDFNWEDPTLIGYKCHPAIKAEIAV